MADKPSPSLAQLAARELQRAKASGSTRSVADEREAHIALLTRTNADVRARASRRRSLAFVAAIAAVLVAAVGLRAVLSKEHVVPAQPGAIALGTRYDVHVEGSPGLLRAHDHVTSTSAPAAVVVATGTRLTLDRASDLEVVEAGHSQLFALGAGGVRADVAKLQEGERFVVRTSDTEVEVRGTSFRVERVLDAPSCHPALHTRVIVTEGVVVVRHAGAEDRVKAGEQWPAPCPTTAAPLQTGAPSAPFASAAPSTSPPGLGLSFAAPALAPAPASVPASSAAASPGTGSKLAQSNELFAKAQAARRSGDSAGAIALFDKLLDEYPSSPIVESATVERMRTLDPIDRRRSVAAARDYLARFPHGFARPEAEAIVALGP